MNAWTHRTRGFLPALIAINVSVIALGAFADAEDTFMKHSVVYRTVQVDNVAIFYREAGPKDAPTILLLHGLPSSSRMFDPLFSRLADRYHLIAPDYPGFGHSEWPSPKAFHYTFDHLASVMEHFTQAVGLSRYTMYMQDYGAPVGFRMASLMTRDWEPIGKLGGHFGQTGPRTRRHCASICYLWQLHKPATLGMTRMCNATTRIFGPMNSRS